MKTDSWLETGRNSLHPARPNGLELLGWVIDLLPREREATQQQVTSVPNIHLTPHYSKLFFSSSLPTTQGAVS